jgi:hypothetical protein
MAIQIDSTDTADARTIAQRPDRMSYERLVTEDAEGFDDGFGYSCFKTMVLAEEYRGLLEDRDRQRDDLYGKGKHVIYKFAVPAKARYAKGHIRHGFWGAGMRALRTEKLRNP